ncbi:DUF2584 family protein [Ectobacillus antri]|jgi:hypothetical protein|uniref:DUF2584 family protein n=1 Tax=Ectobacillus antri TaxID=2486280 RepID=A0ABT6H381_9BACI|nr:DUF2584 family protein [Ectobacillus antri]MDG4656390.1 DUF2584 family protein [Ectobacillus antri]MDG5753065.1 DUF2584 family protein [Ectobacillus antri]
MKFEMHTNIVTYGKETRVDIASNTFELKLDGYHLYPLQETMTLWKFDKEPIGQAVPEKISWEAGQTILWYRLISLHSVN